MVTFETSIFTKKIATLLNDEEYRDLQDVLVEFSGYYSRQRRNTQNSMGCKWTRKKRWCKGNLLLGKPADQLFMLYACAKNERDDLTKDQLSVLREAVVAEFKNEK